MWLGVIHGRVVHWLRLLSLRSVAGAPAGGNAGSPSHWSPGSWLAGCCCHSRAVSPRLVLCWGREEEGPDWGLRSRRCPCGCYDQRARCPPKPRAALAAAERTPPPSGPQLGRFRGFLRSCAACEARRRQYEDDGGFRGVSEGLAPLQVTDTALQRQAGDTPGAAPIGRWGRESLAGGSCRGPRPPRLPTGLGRCSPIRCSRGGTSPSTRPPFSPQARAERLRPGAPASPAGTRVQPRPGIRVPGAGARSGPFLWLPPFRSFGARIPPPLRGISQGRQPLCSSLSSSLRFSAPRTPGGRSWEPPGGRCWCCW